MITTLWILTAAVGVELATRWAKRGDWPGVIKGSLVALGSFIIAAAYIVASAVQ